MHFKDPSLSLLRLWNPGSVRTVAAYAGGHSFLRILSSAFPLSMRLCSLLFVVTAFSHSQTAILTPPSCLLEERYRPTLEDMLLTGEQE